MKNGFPVPVKVSIFHVYYQGQNEGLEPFPEDYAVVAGSPDRTEEELRKLGGAGIDWVRIAFAVILELLTECFEALRHKRREERSLGIP